MDAFNIASFFPVLMLVLAFAFSFFFRKKERSFYHNLIPWILFFSVGLQGIWAWFGQVFYANEVAASIGWAPSPFLFELATYNLGCGIAGLLVLYFGVQYWFCLSIIEIIFLGSAAYGHLKALIIHHDYAINNAGPILYTDILIPVILVICWITHYFTAAKTPKH